MEEKFSLKDALFNQRKVQQIAREIHAVYPSFAVAAFIKGTVDRFPELELKQRIQWISERLQKYLPSDYRQALVILLAALPPPNDHTKTDNDFGDFIYAPYADFVARYGCTKENLPVSLAALKEITMRFSAEDAIRSFINAFPEETLATLNTWSTDSHYHVRRLTSEGTRPKLPWAQKISLSPQQAIPILDTLFFDTTRFVTRSVANHINDISKIDPTLALETLDRWKQSGKQTAVEMTYIINHALRTLIKKGHTDAITFLNLSPTPLVTLSDFAIQHTTVTIGESLEFSFTLQAHKNEEVIIDYVLYFQSKSGKVWNKKVYKIKKLFLAENQSVVIQKRHPLRRQMTTRTLYPGPHKIEIQINGAFFAEKIFDVLSPGEKR